MKTKIFDYLLRVHTLPPDLRIPKEQRPAVDPELWPFEALFEDPET